MEQYRDFIDEVADNYQSYSETQWRKAQEKFKNFSEIWYEKFKDEFSTKEQVLIVGYSAKFNYYYAKSQSQNVLDGIMELIDGEDVQQLIDGIKEDGSKVINQLEQIFNNI